MLALQNILPWNAVVKKSLYGGEGADFQAMYRRSSTPRARPGAGQLNHGDVTRIGSTGEHALDNSG